MAASKWFAIVRDNGTENGEIASIFCDISECANTIEHLRGGKVPQTEALREQRLKLWTMVQDLMTKAEGYSADFRLQTWVEIVNLIDKNVQDFLYVAEPAQLVELLEQISTGAEDIARDYPDLKELSQNLQVSSRRTIDRISTVQS